MTIDEYRETVIIPNMLRMVGLPDTPEGRLALHKLATEDVVSVVKAKAEREAA